MQFAVMQLKYRTKYELVVCSLSSTSKNLFQAILRGGFFFAKKALAFEFGDQLF